MELKITKDELYTIIKKAVKDVIKEERIDSILKNIPPVSDEEMEDIRKCYNKPANRKVSTLREKINL